MGLLYSVTATLPDAATKAEYVSWLVGGPGSGGHVQQVIEAGAQSAMVVALTEPKEELKVTVHYRFSNEAALKTYLEVHAPALRADGLARFGSKGLRWERTIGSVLRG